MTGSTRGPTLARMTRRPLIGVGPVAVVAIVAIALVSPASAVRPRPRGTTTPASPPAGDAPGRQPGDRAPPRPPAPCPEARALRLRAVLGDERRHRRPSREDAADDPRPLLGHPHQDRQDRHRPDRLQADHRADREADHPRGARPDVAGPARLHELRDGAEPAFFSIARRSRTRRSRRSSRWPTDRGRRHQRRRRADRRRPDRRPTATSSVDCARRCGRRMPKASVSVAVTSGPDRGGMAAAAAKAGADRIFMMAYDYHYASSQPGASSPMDRRDGADPTLSGRSTCSSRSASRSSGRSSGCRCTACAGGSRARRSAQPPRRRRHLGAGRQPAVPRRPARPARARSDRARRVLCGRRRP